MYQIAQLQMLCWINFLASLFVSLDKDGLLKIVSLYLLFDHFSLTALHAGILLNNCRLSKLNNTFCFNFFTDSRIKYRYFHLNFHLLHHLIALNILVIHLWEQTVNFNSGIFDHLVNLLCNLWNILLIHEFLEILSNDVFAYNCWFPILFRVYTIIRFIISGQLIL